MIILSVPHECDVNIICTRVAQSVVNTECCDLKCTLLAQSVSEIVQLLRLGIYIITAYKRSLGQGNIFTGICLSTGSSGRHLPG